VEKSLENLKQTDRWMDRQESTLKVPFGKDSIGTKNRGNLKHGLYPLAPPSDIRLTHEGISQPGLAGFSKRARDRLKRIIKYRRYLR
jgi:hypothetical protein